MIRWFFVLSIAALTVCANPVHAQVTREVSYNAHAVVHLNAKLRFTTLIILPESEQILDFVCGDKEFWIVSGAQNLAYVKPAKAGATTNLNLVTASGNVYTFLLTEGSAERIRKRLERNIRALASLVRFDPYIAGPTFTQADCAAWASFGVISMATQAVYGEDLLVAGGIDWKPYSRRLAERPSVQRVVADRKADQERAKG